MINVGVYLQKPLPMDPAFDFTAETQNWCVCLANKSPSPLCIT